MTINKIEQKSKGQYLVLIESIGFFLLSEKDIFRYQIEEGSELTENQYEEIKAEILLPRAKKRALLCLQRTFLSEKKMREKLMELYPEEIVEDVILFLYQYKYLDDRRYATHFIRIHLEEKSKRELQMQLYQRGISKEIFLESLELCLLEREEQVGEEEAPEQAAIRNWLNKKISNFSNISEKEKTKTIQTLLRKGFLYNDIKSVWITCCNTELDSANNEEI